MDSAVLEAIRQHLVACYPEEGCGLLLGAGEPLVARDHVPFPNGRRADGDARTRYAVTPDDYMRAERHAAELGLEIVGVYHSHPDVAARPSLYDIEHAWPFFRYLIVSVVHGTVSEERVFMLRDDRQGFIEHDLSIRRE